MTIQELANRIGLPKEAYHVALQVQISDGDYVAERKSFYEDMNAFLKQWDEKDHKYEWALSFYLRLSTEVYEQYKNEKLSDEVFDQTFYDLTIWCRECVRKHGVYGLEELWWLGQSVKMKLFRLGRLQFEPIELKDPLEGGGVRFEAGTKGLNVHIPADGPLDFPLCLEAFRRAEAFFSDRKDGKPAFYMCDSWLLSPALKELLPENSNIIRFQNLFQVVKIHHAFPQAEQRIFGKVLKDKTEYPEYTSLQKKAKAYVLDGKDLGIGIGIIENIDEYI